MRKPFIEESQAASMDLSITKVLKDVPVTRSNRSFSYLMLRTRAFIREEASSVRASLRAPFIYSGLSIRVILKERGVFLPFIRETIRGLISSQGVNS